MSGESLLATCVGVAAGFAVAVDAGVGVTAAFWGGNKIGPIASAMTPTTMTPAMPIRIIAKRLRSIVVYYSLITFYISHEDIHITNNYAIVPCYIITRNMFVFFSKNALFIRASPPPRP